MCACHFMKESVLASWIPPLIKVFGNLEGGG